MVALGGTGSALRSRPSLLRCQTTPGGLNGGSEVELALSLPHPTLTLPALPAPLPGLDVDDVKLLKMLRSDDAVDDKPAPAPSSGAADVVEELTMSPSHPRREGDEAVPGSVRREAPKTPTRCCSPSPPAGGLAGGDGGWLLGWP
tara:strand:+ start:1868 stop:2302 length:435 start_codon:yes stop_codon:yes gene_type:complete